MNWQLILKQPKVRIGSKITTNLGTDSTPEDNHCLKKVLEYLEKMKQFPRRNAPLTNSTDMKYFLGNEPFKCGQTYRSYLCNEKVACVVLKLLERLKSQGSGMFEEDVVDGDDAYFVEIVLESTKKLKTTDWDQWFDDAQDAAFVILITGPTNAEYYQITYESHLKIQIEIQLDIRIIQKMIINV